MSAERNGGRVVVATPAGLLAEARDGACVGVSGRVVAGIAVFGAGGGGAAA